MAHPTGRHRRQHWLHPRLQALIEAAKAVFTGADTHTPEPPEEEEVLAPPPAQRPAAPEWPPLYAEAFQAHTARVREHFQRPLDLPEPALEPTRTGGCVDDDGMAAVRPYLVAHEQRKHVQKRAGDVLADLPAVPCQESRVDDEWRELAGLIRLWGARRPAAV